MDAADFVDGVGGDGPEAAIFDQVPGHFEVVFGDGYVVDAGVLLALPVPAVAGDDAGLVGLVVLLGDQASEFGGGVADAEVVVDVVECGVGGLADL